MMNRHMLGTTWVIGWTIEIFFGVKILSNISNVLPTELKLASGELSL